MKEKVTGFEGEQFDSIRVLAIQSKEEQQPIGILMTGKDWKFPIVKQNICTTVQATRLIELWNSLPDGEQSRCHSPGFAFQLIIKSEPVFAAAICWRCNNITFAGSSANLTWRTFDGESDGALQLLQLCQEVAGNFSGGLK